VRAFTAQPVKAGDLDQILGAANAAPSAGNLQAYEIFLVTQGKQRALLARAALAQFFFAQARVALVFCAPHAGAAA